ncbi:MAG: Na(+)-translocating NADH-quinone reductase subunit F [Flavobacteriaceae bacterium]|nr:Na(+)-translocating NADH-quinone reductase subunit F [Flavobacteriaceae bacterium]
MKAPQRFEEAIQKLYTAFYSDSLNPECCKQCAVGNILNNTDAWRHLADDHGSLRLNYVGLVHEKFGRKFGGYSPQELLQIEVAFLRGCGYELPLHHSSFRPENTMDREVLFSGMCAAVELLCALDGVENVMDYSKLFAQEVPKKSIFETV